MFGSFSDENPLRPPGSTFNVQGSTLIGSTPMTPVPPVNAVNQMNKIGQVYPLSIGGTSIPDDGALVLTQGVTQTTTQTTTAVPDPPPVNIPNQAPTTSSFLVPLPPPTQPTMVYQQPSISSYNQPSVTTTTCTMAAPPSGSGTPFPWPVIIVLIIGLIATIYAFFAIDVLQSRRIFAGIILGLWTLIWVLILWLMWSEHHYRATWWMAILPVFVIVLFVVLVLVFNLGSNV